MDKIHPMDKTRQDKKVGDDVPGFEKVLRRALASARAAAPQSLPIFADTKKASKGTFTH